MTPATLATTLRQAAERLHPISSSARLDAEILLAAALKRPRSHLIAHSDQTLDASTAQQFERWLEQRAAGVPVAYLTGHKEFWSLDLEVTPDVLDPRPETELLVESALKWLPADRPARLLDLGTGSGAIALAIARERPDAQVVATDRSSAALEVARRNAARLGIGNVTFLCGDWYAPLARMKTSMEARFDVIASNPPYIAADDPALQTLHAEPLSALTPGASGLEAIEKIALGAGAYLKPSGWLAIEHGMEQGAAVKSLFLQHGLREVFIIKDLAGRERVTAGRSV